MIGGLSAASGLAFESKPAMSNFSVDMQSKAQMMARRSRWMEVFAQEISRRTDLAHGSVIHGAKRMKGGKGRRGFSPLTEPDGEQRTKNTRPL